MRSDAHLFIALTAHGYGHLAQIAPIIQCLHHRHPQLRFTVQTTLDPQFVQQRVQGPVRIIPSAADVSLPMQDPLTVLWEQGLASYEQFEVDYTLHAEHQRQLFIQDPPNLVIANIPWLPLEIADQCAIPSIALCSLNWYDILQESPVGQQLSPALTQRLQRAYACAQQFIRPAPAMPMTWLANGCDIGPIAAPCVCDRQRLQTLLTLDSAKPWILVLFGGAGHLPIQFTNEALIAYEFIVPEHQPPHPAVHSLAHAGCTVQDVMGCCDAVITKPGYGTFVEAACHGCPLLVVRRDDWAESRYLLTWLQHNVPTVTITAQQLATGEFLEALQQLIMMESVPPVAATGTQEAVAIIESYLR
jgi:hypothetical protein